MWKLLARWSGGRTDGAADDAACAPSQIQRLRLELAEHDATIATLQQDLARERATVGRNVAETLDQRLEDLFSQAAAPIAQFLTQAFLVEQQGKDVPPRDIVRLARRIVRAFEDAGLEIREEVGTEARFDPNLHESLSSDQPIQAGAAVAVRFCGIAYRGRLLRKAGVSPTEN